MILLYLKSCKLLIIKVRHLLRLLNTILKVGLIILGMIVIGMLITYMVS